METQGLWVSQYIGYGVDAVMHVGVNPYVLMRQCELNTGEHIQWDGDDGLSYRGVVNDKTVYYIGFHPVVMEASRCDMYDIVDVAHIQVDCKQAQEAE